VSVGLVGNFETVRYEKGQREKKEFLQQGVKALALALEKNNILLQLDLRENSMGPATGCVVLVVFFVLLERTRGGRTSINIL
jgi:hypothetical protein